MTAPARKPPVYEERPLTMSRTEFVRRGDSKGGIIDSITVSHPMVPDPRVDDAFLFRDPENPNRVLGRFAAEDGSLHPRVSIQEVHFQPGQLAHIKSLCQRDRIVCTRALQTRLKAAVSEEVTRLIKGKSLKLPRLQPRKLEAEELPAHEKVLAGQYGVFVNPSATKGQQLTLANGKVLGLYAGSVLEKGVDEAFADSGRGTEYDMALSRNRTMSADGFANSMAFVNTALKPGSRPRDLQYDDKRINAAFVNFRIRMTDKDGETCDEHAVALIGLNNLYDKRSRPAGEVRVSYGDSYEAFENPRKDVSEMVKKEGESGDSGEKP